MPASFRLDPDTEAVLERLARTREVSKSQIVREAVAAYGAQLESIGARPTLHERLKSSIGKFPTGGLNLSVDSGEKFAALLRANHEEHQLVARRRVTKKGPAGTRKPSKSR